MNYSAVRLSRSALENFPKSWNHKGHSGNIKGHLSARMPLMFPNFEKSWKHKGHSGNIRGWKHKGHGNVLYIIVYIIDNLVKVKPFQQFEFFAG